MTSCWHWSRSFLWCPLLLCRPVGQLPASTRTVSIKHKEQRYKNVEERAKCTFRNISLSNPSGNWATQTHTPHYTTLTHTRTHGRRLTAPSGSCAAEGRMKGNTKTTTRERQVASLAAPHTHTHTHTRTHTHVHNLLPPQTPCCAHLWKCQILDSFSSPTLFLPPLCFYLSLLSPTMNLSPPFSLSQKAPLCKHSSCKLAAWLTFNWLLKRHFLLARIPPWKPLWLHMTPFVLVCDMRLRSLNVYPCVHLYMSDHRALITCRHSLSSVVWRWKALDAEAKHLHGSAKNIRISHYLKCCNPCTVFCLLNTSWVLKASCFSPALRSGIFSGTEACG